MKGGAVFSRRMRTWSAIAASIALISMAAACGDDDEETTGGGSTDTTAMAGDMYTIGFVGALTGDNALKAKVGETVRIYFGVGGPNLTSSFHVIGAVFDRVFAEGSLSSPPATDIQTTQVPAGGATMVEFKADYPGSYVLVDHSLGRLQKGGAGMLEVEGPADKDIYDPGTAKLVDAGH